MGAVKRNAQVTTASYLVLYGLDNKNEYFVYKLNDKHHIWDTQKMKDLDYPVTNDNANNQYYIYNIVEELDKHSLGEIDVERIINYIGFDKGTPIYVYRNEL